MINRRDLLKYFAAGTVIAPVSGPAPLAKLIEVPNVELFKPDQAIVKPLDLSAVDRVVVNLEMKDGSKRSLTVTELGGTQKAPWLEPGGDDMRVMITVYGVRLVSVPTNYRVGWIGGKGELA